MRTQVLEKILPLPFVDEWRVRADDCLVFGASLAGARKRYLAQPLVRYRVHGKNHLHGSKPDQGEIYRRRLAINRLFEHLQRGLCCNTPRLADFTHREFRTIERPTFGQLRNYARVSIGAPVPWIRRLSCIADMFAHYLSVKWPVGLRVQSESTQSTNDPDILQFPSSASDDSAADDNAEDGVGQHRRAA
jgi:hypothetical protein